VPKDGRLSDGIHTRFRCWAIPQRSGIANGKNRRIAVRQQRAIGQQEPTVILWQIEGLEDRWCHGTCRPEGEGGVDLAPISQVKAVAIDPVDVRASHDRDGPVRKRRHHSSCGGWRQSSRERALTCDKRDLWPEASAVRGTDIGRQCARDFNTTQAASDHYNRETPTCERCHGALQAGVEPGNQRLHRFDRDHVSGLIDQDTITCRHRAHPDGEDVKWQHASVVEDEGTAFDVYPSHGACHENRTGVVAQAGQIDLHLVARVLAAKHAWQHTGVRG